MNVSADADFKNRRKLMLSIVFHHLRFCESLSLANLTVAEHDCQFIV